MGDQSTIIMLSYLVSIGCGVCFAYLLIIRIRKLRELSMQLFSHALAAAIGTLVIYLFTVFLLAHNLSKAAGITILLFSPLGLLLGVGIITVVMDAYHDGLNHSQRALESRGEG